MTWLNIWLVVLAISLLSFLIMMIVIGGGAIKELKMTFDDLRADTDEATSHPEELDKEI
ncbi:hypothetical protein Pla110_21710 [Polystyrenella longa]|uniref:Uncharacterized protein n=1 Tax=Polystyrenella longa TaxID=2528007 RepID=A0A518CMI3_9PLAN|nr:hypothetical protein [Polystyrenella longa]QDU80441.1 hypothetical protein Pla110_21710 [Polystyrenella longa]